MDIDCSNPIDFDAWIVLVKEVEPLFGPMADEIAFQEALRQAIKCERAFCIRSNLNKKERMLKGGIIISKESNEIVWLAVSKQCRRKGFGRQLLKFAISKLNPKADIFVQTFDESVPEGKPARKLYTESGFADVKDGGPNTAGVPTVIMKLAASGFAGK